MEYLIAIVALIFLYRAWVAYLHCRRDGTMHKQMEMLEQRITALEKGELADLRRRVEALEQIITDTDYDLKRQFQHIEVEVTPRTDAEATASRKVR